MQEDKRLIEESFPVKEVSKASLHDRRMHHGHISTLHIWWAPRPLASSRATAYAALTPSLKGKDDKDYALERNKKHDFIIKLSKWENSLSDQLIKKARKEILEANGGKRPKVLDPFAGRGTIPLEALRLGCETYSSDLNPVAVLIQKCALEYPQKYGSTKIFTENGLLGDVKKWSAWVHEKAKEELKDFYEETDDTRTVGWIWARTIQCQNPLCGVEIPLMKQFWLVNKEKTKQKKKIALCPKIVNGSVKVVNGRVEFKIVDIDSEVIPDRFDPTKGTVSKAVPECPACHAIVKSQVTKQLFQKGEGNARLIAVVTYKQGVRGKHYRIATSDDEILFERTKEFLAEKQEKLTLEWGMDAVPNEPTPEGKGSGAERAFSIRDYGINTWGDLFNTRQKLVLITFVEKIKAAYQQIMAEVDDAEYAKAVVSYLALALDMTAAANNRFVLWRSGSESIKRLYSQQILPMSWDYIEVNPFSGLGGSFESGCKYYFKVIEHCSQSSSTPAKKVIQSSATNLPHHDNFFDAVFTDPPYYDNVPYSYLSDFFYVWLKRTLSDVDLGLFSTPLTPKSNEVVAYSHKQGGLEEGKRFFEKKLKLSFQEIHRVLKSNGIAIIVYAHKSTAGWETLINSLLDSGMIITGAWPIYTENTSRPRAQESAALASSIYIVARKMARDKTGFYKNVKLEMETYLTERLENLWNEGMRGTDFFIAGIGSAIEIFGKYEQVMDSHGKMIRADSLLADVQKMVTDYAVRQILRNGFEEGKITALTRFYVIWRWEYGTKRVQFDDARKLAQSCGVDLVSEWGGRSFIKKEKQFIRVLGPQDRTVNELKGASELIDILHHVLLLWTEDPHHEKILHVFEDNDYQSGDAFHRVAQAISETLPNGNKEKQLLDGFLHGDSLERVKKEIEQLEKNKNQEETRQMSLFDLSG